MGEKKLKIVDVARATGLNRSTITSLYKEDATRIDMHTIDALCVYFKCSIGDVFEFIPEKA
jgi:putative transcriptional regulator